MAYIPVAEYTIGCCYDGQKQPYRTTKVCADSRHEAMEKGWKALSPDTTEHICYVSVAPNPEHLAYEEKMRAYHDEKDQIKNRS